MELQLTSNEKSILESVYGRQAFSVGYNPNKIEAIRDLQPDEKKFFTGKNFVSPHFFVQTLYKISGSVSPMRFMLAVNHLLAANENMHANFCNVGSRTVKIIKLVESVKPEVIFRNFTSVDKDELDEEFRKILEADMRRDCDIRHDPLIRFAVFKTDDKECAVLITLAHLISKNFNAPKFFSEVLNLSGEFKPKEKPAELPPENQAVIREYWAKVLTNAPLTAALPYEHVEAGSYRQKALHTTIPADILSDLRGRAQLNRMMLTAILQSAWGFMLQLANKRRDCLFCQILSSNQDAENPALNLIPVRFTGDNNLTVEQTVMRQFRQLVVSQTYSKIDWSSLSDLTGRGKKLFNHFLSFKEFQSSELNYVETPVDDYGKIIMRNSWDAQGMKLGVYFRYSEKNLAISFLYDARQFLNYGVERLCGLYKSILQQMLVDWNLKFSAFSERLATRINMNLEAQSPEDLQKKIRDFLSQLPILQGRFEGTIDLFANKSEIITYFEGDRLSGDVLNEKFIFVVSGKLVRNVDTGDGWYNPLDVIGKNSFVNPTNFLEKRRLTLSAEVLTEQAELFFIPKTAMIEILRKNPEIALSVMNYALEQMEKYQMLWLQS